MSLPISLLPYGASDAVLLAWYVSHIAPRGPAHPLIQAVTQIAASLELLGGERDAFVLHLVKAYFLAAV